MKRYIVEYFSGNNTTAGPIHMAIQKFLDKNPDYDLDQMTSATTGDGYISVVVVLKLRED